MHVPRICPFCDEPVEPTDAGPVTINGVPNSAHRNCLIRSSSGSVAHFYYRCSCYVEGSTEHDPPGMTRREAADAAAALWMRPEGRPDGPPRLRDR